jgi:hypothetical protein
VTRPEANAIARCELTELPLEGCAHCRGDVLEEPTIPPTSRPWFHAIYPGTCAACAAPFEPGTPIRLEAPRGWRADCCREDTP